MTAPLRERIRQVLIDYQEGITDGLDDAVEHIMELVPEPQPIDTAPLAGDFLAYNAMTGWYRTRLTGDKFPFHGWDGKEGVWYPRPSRWMPLPAAPERAALNLGHSISTGTAK